MTEIQIVEHAAQPTAVVRELVAMDALAEFFGRAFSAVLRRYHAIEVHDFHELTETLEVLGRRRWPRGAPPSDPSRSRWAA